MTTSDVTLEHRLGRVLWVGSFISTAMLAAGLIAFFAAPRMPVTIWLLNAGLLLLMATPVVRVVVAAAGYVQNRDWFFTSLALTVFAVLVISIIVAFV